MASGPTRIPRPYRTIADLDRAARSICRHFRTDTVIVIGSQSALVHGLAGPGPLTMSGEIDMYPREVGAGPKPELRTLAHAVLDQLTGAR